MQDRCSQVKDVKYQAISIFDAALLAALIIFIIYWRLKFVKCFKLWQFIISTGTAHFFLFIKGSCHCQILRKSQLHVNWNIVFYSKLPQDAWNVCCDDVRFIFCTSGELFTSSITFSFCLEVIGILSAKCKAIECIKSIEKISVDNWKLVRKLPDPQYYLLWTSLITVATLIFWFWSSCLSFQIPFSYKQNFQVYRNCIRSFQTFPCRCHVW